jgi:uncharacterized membrane protein YphA (DoxX/SURF4 family)
MRASDPIRVAQIALRWSLAAAFLSAVADRFGWWEPFGQGSWGSVGRFVDYAHQLVPFASGWLLTVIVWTATATEAALGVLLLAGWRPRLVGAATCLVLTIFGIVMGISSVSNHRLATRFSLRQAQPRPTPYSARHRRDTPGAVFDPDARNRRKPTLTAGPLTSHLTIRRGPARGNG